MDEKFRKVQKLVEVSQRDLLYFLAWNEVSDELSCDVSRDNAEKLLLWV